MNSMTPRRKPVCTVCVCWPSKVDSRVISNHQEYKTIRRVANPNSHKQRAAQYPCMYKTPPTVKQRAEIPAKLGQGLGSTK